MGERVVKARLTVQVSEWERGWLAAAAAVRATGTEVERLEQKKQAFEQVGRGLMVTGTALTAVTALSVKAAAGWESAWAGVTKTVDGTTEELSRVETGLRDLTSVLPASHDEIAAVAEAAGQLGIQTPNVVAFTRTMIDLGETTNLSANDAATALARFTNIMGTSQDEVDNLGSALVGLGNNYATTESEILEMSMRLAGAGRQIGLSEGDVLGLATALSSVGIEAEAGGSAMSKVMIDIASSVDEGGARLELFAKAAGMSADAFAEQWRTEPSAALASFVKGLSNAESQGKSTIGILSELGITEVRMRDALLRSSSAADQFSGAMADGNQAFEENNALTIEAAKRYETVESKLAIAGNAVRDAAIDFGQVFLPAVGAAAEGVAGFSAFIGDLPDPVQGIMGILTGAVGLFALVGGAALLAVPKIAQFKVSLDALGISMRTVGLVGGGAILALTALVTVVGAVASAQAQAREQAEAYADTLAEGSKKVTAASRELAVEALKQGGALLTFNWQSAYDAAEKLGVGLDTVTDAALGNQAAMDDLSIYYDALNGDMDALNKIAEDTGLSQADARLAIEAMANGIKSQNDAIDESVRLKSQEEKATAASTDAAESAAQAYTAQTDAVADLTAELTDLIDTINEANGVGQTAVTANARYQSALAGLSDQAERNGSSLNRATAAGSANAAALADVAGAAQNAAQAQFEQDKSTMSADEATTKYVDTLKAQRDAFIGAGEKAGFSRDEVIKLADEVFKLPSAKEIAVIAETATAQKDLNQWITNNSGREVRVKIAADGTSIKMGSFNVTPNAAGGLYEGGVKTFAGGGVEPGIYPYTPGGIHKFAEQYAEGYVSMDPARRDKSEGVWTAIGNRMGFSGESSASAAAPADVRVILQPKGGVDLLQYIDARVERSEEGLNSTLRGA